MRLFPARSFQFTSLSPSLFLTSEKMGANAACALLIFAQQQATGAANHPNEGQTSQKPNPAGLSLLPVLSSSFFFFFLQCGAETQREKD